MSRIVTLLVGFAAGVYAHKKATENPEKVLALKASVAIATAAIKERLFGKAVEQPTASATEPDAVGEVIEQFTTKLWRAPGMPRFDNIFTESEVYDNFVNRDFPGCNELPPRIGMYTQGDAKVMVYVQHPDGRYVLEYNPQTERMYLVRPGSKISLETRTASEFSKRIADAGLILQSSR